MSNCKPEKYDTDGTRSKLFIKKDIYIECWGEEVIVLKNMK